MSLSPNTNDVEDRLVHAVHSEVPRWMQNLAKPPRRKRWKFPVDGATWFDWRDFGTVGFCETGPDGRAVYVDTAAPVLVSVESACTIAWPRSKNWLRLDKNVLPENVKTMRARLPIFETPLQAWTFFAEHYCRVRVALFEVHHGKETGYVPVAQLSDGRFCTRLQDRFASFDEAKRSIFESFSFVFVTTKPQVFLDEKGIDVTQSADFNGNSAFWTRGEPVSSMSPFAYPPNFFRWTGSYWKNTSFKIDIKMPKTSMETSNVEIETVLSIPSKLKLFSVNVAFEEVFQFEKHKKNAGLRKFVEAKTKKLNDGKTSVSLTLAIGDYASSFISVRSQPWAFLPMVLRFKGEHPDILVLGVVASRYLRGDIRSGSLYCAPRFKKKRYFCIPHWIMPQNADADKNENICLNPSALPGKMKREIARFVDIGGVMTSVVALEQSEQPVPETTRLCPGEALVLLVLLASLSTVVSTKRGSQKIPLYPRTSVIYPIDSRLATGMSLETKLDHCAILNSPLWKS